MKDKTVPVRVNILRIIYKATGPLRTRLDAMLKLHYEDKINMSPAELTTLFEFRSAAATSELMLEDYLSQAEEHEVEQLEIPSREFQLLLDLSKTVELSTRTPIACSGLWTH
jgi:hypothetical protein